MSKKFFKGRVYIYSFVRPYVVWDGELNFRSAPPSSNLVAAGVLTNDHAVAIAEMELPSDAVIELLRDTIKDHSGLLIWTKDHSIYQAMVKSLTEQSHRLQ
jgi:hypothetical protein